MPYIRKHAKSDIEKFLDDKTITKFIVLDVETNGLGNNCSVLSCSAIKYEINPETFAITELNRFDCYYYPVEQFNPSAIAVNGLTEKVITEKRGNANYPKHFNQDTNLEKFCDGVHRFVAHNISFETRFIPFLQGNKQFCTMMTNMDIVAIEYFERKNEWKYPSLSETANYYGIQFNHNELHRSMYDTEITATIFTKMIDDIKNNDNQAENVQFSLDYKYVDDNFEKFMLEDLKNINPHRRSRAVEMLGRIKSTKTIESIIEIALKDNNYKSKWNAIEALGEIGDSSAIESLINIALKDEHYEFRWMAIDALGKIGDPKAIEPLIIALNDKSLKVRKYAINSLRKFKEPIAISAIRDYEDTTKETKTATTNKKFIGNTESNFDHLHNTEGQEWNDSCTKLTIKIKHIGLGVSRSIRDDEELVYERVAEQFKKWDERYSRILQKNKSKTDKGVGLRIAEERTIDAQNKLKQIDDLLTFAFNITNTIILDSLKDTRMFNIQNPKYNLEGNLRDIYEIPPPTKPTLKELPIEPDIRLYKPKISFFDNLFESIKAKKIKQAKSRYQEHMAAWEKSVDKINTLNSNINEQYNRNLKEYEDKKQAITKRYDDLEEEWKNRRELFYKKQTEHNDKIDKLKISYFNKETEAVKEYCEIVLNSSKYPDTFPKNIKIDYKPGIKTVIVEYLLPAHDNLPSLKKVKYISSSKEFKESFMSEAQKYKYYELTIYKITLRTLHELFVADQAEAIDEIIFNGWVNAINKATGKSVTSCILTIHTKKAVFSQINLKNIDPKICFNSLKGMGDKFYKISAVHPIAQIHKDNKPYIPSKQD